MRRLRWLALGALLTGLLVSAAATNAIVTNTHVSIDRESIGVPDTSSHEAFTAPGSTITVTGTATVTTTAAEHLRFTVESHHLTFMAPTGASLVVGDYSGVGDPAGVGPTTAVFNVDDDTCGASSFRLDEATYDGSGNLVSLAGRALQDCSSSGGRRTWVVVRYASASTYFDRTITPGAINFGSVEQGLATVTQTVTVANHGPGTSVVSNVSITGPNAVDFQLIRNGCTSPLVTGTSCGLDVRFDSSAPTGAKSANLVIVDANAPSGRRVALAGTTTPPGLAALLISPIGGAETGDGMSMTVRAIDTSGNDFAGYRGEVEFTSDDPSAQLPSAYTFTETDAGSHTFRSVMFCAAGTSTVTATDTVLTDAETFDVDEGGAKTLELASLPSHTAPGAAFSTTVKALNGCGDVDTNFVGTIGLETSDPDATVPAPHLFALSDVGQHTFPGFVLRNGGLQAIVAFDEVDEALFGIDFVTVDGPTVNPATVVRGNDWYRRLTYTSGPHDLTTYYGNPGDVAIIGDWDGDGVRTPGVFRSGQFLLSNSFVNGIADEVFNFGNPTDVPVAGDWDGDGTDTVGVYRDGFFYLSNTPQFGIGEMVWQYGNPGDRPVAGDWDGDGDDTIGVVRGDTTWLLTNRNNSLFAEGTFFYGNPGDFAIPGDWDGEGHDTVGVFRGGLWMLSNRLDSGQADYVFGFGSPGDIARP